MPETPKRRPWWAVALAGGFGAVLATLLALGLIAVPARGSEPKVVSAGVSATLSEAERLARIEATLKELSAGQAQISERLAHIEGRLERR